MPATRSREYHTFSYDPRAGPLGVDFIRQLEGYLRRLEQRIETLQDAVETLTTRIAALEAAP